MSQVIIHTDGSCRPNPGPGGWAAILTCGEHQKEIYGGEADTGINQMELTAVLKGLEALKKPCHVIIVTDSQNVIGWLLMGWKRKDAGVRRLCAEIETVIEAKQLIVEYEKVKSHSGDPMNERADQLAVAAIPH